MAGGPVSCCWIQASCRQALPCEAGVSLPSKPCTCMSSTWAGRLWVTLLDTGQLRASCVSDNVPCIVPGQYEAGVLHIRQGSSCLQEQGSRRRMHGQPLQSEQQAQAALRPEGARLQSQSRSVVLLLC